MKEINDLSRSETVRVANDNPVEKSFRRGLGP